jgi:hypothetical protein
LLVVARHIVPIGGTVAPLRLQTTAHVFLLRQHPHCIELALGEQSHCPCLVVANLLVNCIACFVLMIVDNILMKSGLYVALGEGSPSSMSLLILVDNKPFVLKKKSAKRENKVWVVLDRRYLDGFISHLDVDFTIIVICGTIR